MYSTMRELQALTDERLAGIADPFVEMRQLVADLGVKGQITALLSSILAQGAQLDRIASNSYTHSNGFDVLTLLSSDSPSYKIRLHVWWPDHISQTSEHIHDHSWNFSSMILTGNYRFQIFDVSREGAETYHYRCGFPKEGIGYRIDPLGKSRVRCCFDSIMQEGSAYSLSYDTLHRITNVPGSLTSTLLLHGPFIRRTSRLFSAAPIINPGQVPKNPFNAEELAERLRAYISNLAI